MTLAYGNMPLDRCTNQRKIKRWLNHEFNKENTLFCLIDDGKCFFNKKGEQSPLYLSKSQLPTLNVDSCIYLGKGPLAQNSDTEKGTEQVVSIFTVDFNKLRFSTQEELLSLGEWQVLREVTANLSVIDASIQALAKGLVHWHKSHQFCGHCGHSNKPVEAGHARRCSDCRNMTFPRTDPAVIMLVEKMFSDGIPRCLLGRQASWTQGMYSTLAGFVDPGETLEQAVIREVVEETGVIVENPQYLKSQPWPFPASIMLGFTAVATRDLIDISHDDLEDAQWFTREQLRGFSVNNDSTEEATYKMSSRDSISSYLITAWLNKEIGQY
jgi:NAD+ diphosphatase